MRVVRWLVLLALAAAPAAARAQDDQVRGEPELDVDERVLVGAVGEQTAARAAFDGETFLVTWRSALWRNELRASRLSASGQLLDTRGIRVDGLERSDGEAAVAAVAKGGTRGFFVAWTRSDNKLTVARVPAQGALVVEPPVVVDEGDPEALTSSPALAAAGDGAVIAWTRGGATPGTFARHLPAGDPAAGPKAVRLADTGAVALLGRGAAGALAAVALPGPNQTIAVHVMRIDALGVPGPLGPAVFTLAGERPGPLSLAEGGGRVAIAAAGMKGETFTEARVVLLDGGLQSVASVMLPLAQLGSAGGPSLAWDGGGFLVMWATAATPDQVAMAGLRIVGLVAAPPFTAAQIGASPFAGDARAPTLATTPQGAFVVWDRIAWRSGGAVADSDVMFTKVQSTLGNALPVVLVSQGTSAEGEPVVAKSPRRLLVAWEDHRLDAKASDIFAAPLTLEGTRAAAPTPVATGAAKQTAPVVAWDGANFVVAWYEGARGLFAARLSEDGALMDATPVAIKDTAALTFVSEPALCADGDGSLLVYSARRTSMMAEPRTTELRALRIPRGLTADRGTDVLLTTTSDTEAAPNIRMACNDKAALLAFTGVLSPGDPARLMLARLERGQTVLARIPGIFRLPHRLTQEWAGIGTDGEGFMVNWRAPNRMGQRTLWATRLDGEGYLLDEQPWAVGGANSGRRVSTTWDGHQYVVLTVDTNGMDPFELVGRRVAKSGALSETSWFKVARLTTPFAGSGLGADAVALGQGRLFVTYEQYDDDDSAGNPRARARILVTPKGSPIDAAPIEPRGGGDAGVSDARDAPNDDARDASADSVAIEDDGADGCGCRVGGGHQPGGTLVGAAIMVIAAVARRRRARRRN